MNDVHELAGLYALDALEGDERARFEHHLDTCAACRDEVASFRETIDDVATAIEPGDLSGSDGLIDVRDSDGGLPPELRERVLSAIATNEPATSIRRVRAGDPLPRTWPRPHLLLAAAAVLIAVIAGGVVIARNNDAQPSGDALVASLHANGATDITMTGNDGDATFVRASDGKRGVIVVDRLAPLDDGHAYQAWTLVTGAPPRPSTVFRPDASGRAVVTLSPLPANVATVAVTIEPRGGSRTPTTPAVFAATVA